MGPLHFFSNLSPIFKIKSEMCTAIRHEMKYQNEKHNKKQINNTKKMAVTSFHCFRSFFHVIFLTSHQNRDIYKISNQNVISKITQPHAHMI